VRRLWWATWTALAAVTLAIAAKTFGRGLRDEADPDLVSTWLITAVNAAIQVRQVILWLDAQAATEVTTRTGVTP